MTETPSKNTQSGKISVTVTEDDGGVRLDRWFKRYYPSLSHGALEKALRNGAIKQNGKKTSANARLEAGDMVSFFSVVVENGIAAEKAAEKAQKAGLVKPAPKPSAGKIQELLDSVLYQDDDIIVINKPAGLAVQGGSGIKISVDSMLDSLIFDAPMRPKLVHRLDKDTSGILVLARNNKAAAALTEAFRQKRITKLYWAVVAGSPKEQEGKIAVPLRKMGKEGEQKIRADDEGDTALTYYRVVQAIAKTAALVEYRPVTGRTHQLRVHSLELGTPILGDGKYGGKEAFIPGLSQKLHLHAREITIPRLGQYPLVVVAPLPPHMRETLAFFGLPES